MSLMTFLLITMGDSTQAISIFLFSVDKIFIAQKLPWLLGSISSVFFDVAVSFVNSNVFFLYLFLL